MFQRTFPSAAIVVCVVDEDASALKTTTEVLSSTGYAQQGPIYILKSNGKKLTKAQVDSLSGVHKGSLQYSMKREQGQTIAEIDLPSSGDQVTDKKTFSSDGSTMQFDSKKVIYKDTLGNVVSSESFKEKLKSGNYSATYKIEGDNTTFSLVNKKKAEKESVDQMQNFKNKLLNENIFNIISDKNFEHLIQYYENIQKYN